MTADQIEKELGWERACIDYPEWGHTDVYLKYNIKRVLLTRRNT